MFNPTLFTIINNRLLNSKGEMAVALSQTPNCSWSSIHDPLDGNINKLILYRDFNSASQHLEFCNQNVLCNCKIEWVDQHVDFRIEFEDGLDTIVLL